MKSKRYGLCKVQHSEIAIKSSIRSWAKEREYFDGITRSKKEIEQIVSEQFQEVTQVAESACEWANCEREVVR